MFISKIKFSLTRNSLKDLSSPDQMHKTLCSGFSSTERPNLLYRVEDDHVLVVSENEPNWKNLDAQTKPYNPSVKKGDVFRFQLMANPVKRRNGKVVAIIQKDEDLIKWMINKGNTHGFEVGQLMFSASQPVSFYHSTAKEQKVFNSVVFKGNLKVIDPVLFLQALCQGIGKAKAFGFGLLTIAR